MLVLGVRNGGFAVAAALALCGLFAAAPAHAQSGGEVTMIGTLAAGGVECPALRGDDGVLYTLTPRSVTAGLDIGERVRVDGKLAEVSMCQQGTTIEVTRLEKAD